VSVVRLVFAPFFQTLHSHLHNRKQIYNCTDKDDEPADAGGVGLPVHAGATVDANMKGLVGV